MNSPTETVATMIEAWERRDAQGIAACFAEEAIWTNMPYGPIAGRSAIQATAERFLADVQSVRFEIFHSGLLAPNILVNERADIFVMTDGRRVDLPVMGIFEVADGLIINWRDYFDAKAMAGIA
jgi:limonene-1,2-epoxide hydrolase